VLIALVVVVAVIALVRGLRSGLNVRQGPAITARTARCAHCAVYFPREEAVVRGGQEYCSREHADAAGQ
jgi:uncharacterized protein